MLRLEREMVIRLEAIAMGTILGYFFLMIVMAMVFLNLKINGYLKL